MLHKFTYPTDVIASYDDRTETAIFRSIRGTAKKYNNQPSERIYNRRQMFLDVMRYYYSRNNRPSALHVGSVDDTTVCIYHDTQIVASMYEPIMSRSLQDDSISIGTRILVQNSTINNGLTLYDNAAKNHIKLHGSLLRDALLARRNSAPSTPSHVSVSSSSYRNVLYVLNNTIESADSAAQKLYDIASGYIAPKNADKFVSYCALRLFLRRINSIAITGRTSYITPDDAKNTYTSLRDLILQPNAEKLIDYILENYGYMRNITPMILLDAPFLYTRRPDFTFLHDCIVREDFQVILNFIKNYNNIMMENKQEQMITQPTNI